MGKNDNEEDRQRDTDKILKFIDCVFSSGGSIDFAEFSRFNTENSSEMLFSVMNVLHERIPCSEFYYREKKEFKKQAVLNALSSSNDIQSAEEKCRSPLRRISSPKFISGYIPQSKASSQNLQKYCALLEESKIEDSV